MTELHQQALDSLCRCCGNSVKKYRDVYECMEYKDEILNTFKVDVTSDDITACPRWFCHCCRLVLQRAMVANENRQVYTHTVKVYTMWRKHADENCTTCNRMEQSTKGGRPPKRKIGRPTQNGYRAATTHIQSIAPTSFWLQQSRILMSAVEPSLTCPLCLDVPDRPIELIPCNNYVCCECVCASLEASRGVSCPCCYEDHLCDLSTVRPIPPIVNEVLSNVVYKCMLCSQNVTLKNATLHLSSNCKTHSTACTSTDAILSAPITQPLTPRECQLTSKLVKRSLQNGAQGPDVR